MDKKLKVLLLLGGTSPEREVSKSTGKSVYTALINLGHEVIILDPAYGINQPLEVEEYFSENDFTEISNENYLDAINLIFPSEISIAFLALHGKYGEDGTIQSLLELKGIKFTGSKVLSSAIAMDKIMSKILFEDDDYDTLGGLILSKAGSIPKNDYTFIDFNLKFTVKEVQNKRIKKVFIEKLNSVNNN